MKRENDVKDININPNLNNIQEPLQNEVDISSDFENKISTAAFWKKQMPRAIIMFIVSGVINNLIYRFLPESIILLLVAFLCSSGATVYLIITVVSYFKITKKVMINLELFDDCDISYDDAIEELKRTTMVDDGIGYTESFLILPHTVLIPFDSMVGMKILNDTFETVIYIDGKRRKFSMRVMRKKIDYKIESILNSNKEKLSPYFKLEIGQVDYSD